MTLFLSLALTFFYSAENKLLLHPDPITFIPLDVDTTGWMYDEFIRLLFLHAHREASALDNELPEESDKFRFLRASCFANLKGAVGLIMTFPRTFSSVF